MLYARRFGVFHADVEKSMRMRRTPSLVKFSRQKGQTGVSRDDVLLTILLQQFKQRMCPRNKRIIERLVGGMKIFPTYHMGCSEGVGLGQTLLRRRRKRNLD